MFPKRTLEGAASCSKANPPPTSIAGKASSVIIIRFSIPAKITAKHPRQPWKRLSLKSLRGDNCFMSSKIIMILFKLSYDIDELIRYWLVSIQGNIFVIEG